MKTIKTVTSYLLELNESEKNKMVQVIEEFSSKTEMTEGGHRAINGLIDYLYEEIDNG